MILTGRRFGPDVARLTTANGRTPRYWGITVGWLFIGIVTWPLDGQVNP